jgi:hypothetical protein
MLRHPIPLERPSLPWLCSSSRQGLAGSRRLAGKWWPKLTVCTEIPKESQQVSIPNVLNPVSLAREIVARSPLAAAAAQGAASFASTLMQALQHAGTARPEEPKVRAASAAIPTLRRALSGAPP